MPGLEANLPSVHANLTTSARTTSLGYPFLKGRLLKQTSCFNATCVLAGVHVDLRPERGSEISKSRGTLFPTVIEVGKGLPQKESSLSKPSCLLPSLLERVIPFETMAVEHA